MSRERGESPKEILPADRFGGLASMSALLAGDSRS